MSKSTAIVKVTAATPQKVALLPEFNAARKRIASIQEHGRRMQHEMILLGFDLNQAKAALGERRGGDRKSTDQSSQRANFDRWEEIVFEQTGLSYDTCNRWMKVAKGAQKSIPMLMAPDVVKKPFNTLPEARKKEIISTLQKLADGQTMAEIMITFGVCKPPKLNGPPKSKKGGGGGGDSQALTAEQLMEQAKGDIDALNDMCIGEAWKTLDDDDLADLENKLTTYSTAVAAELKARGKAQ